MERKFNIGDMVTCESYMSQGETTGIVVAYHPALTVNPYLVLIDKPTGHAGRFTPIPQSLYDKECFTKSIRFPGRIQLKEDVSGYWYPADKLNQAMMQYDPAQQGDTEDDI